MQAMTRAMRAYDQAASNRSLRDQEADVFRRATAALRLAREQGAAIAKVRALADNDRLWTTVIGLVSDQENRLPDALRASLVSVGRAVQREMQREAPDFEFLIDINEQVAAGLSGL